MLARFRERRSLERETRRIRAPLAGLGDTLGENFHLLEVTGGGLLCHLGVGELQEQFIKAGLEGRVIHVPDTLKGGPRQR